MLKRVKAINGHAAFFRFNCELSDEPIGFIPRQKDIPSPYSWGPTHTVWMWERPGKNIPVIAVETRHKYREIFEVPVDMIRKDETECYSI